MIHVSLKNNQTTILPFNKECIQKNTFIDLPSLGKDFKYRRGLVCCATSAETKEEFQSQIDAKTADFYICYSERDNHWDGYEELEDFVISNLMKELKSFLQK